MPAFDGFFREPEGEFQAPFVDPNNFHHVPLSGLPGPLQFFRSTTLDSRSLASTQLVVLALELPDSAIELSSRVLTEAFPDARVAFVRDARVGSAVAECRVVRTGQLAPAIAASVAAMLAGGSWDDSDPIVIDLNSRRYNVSLEFQPVGQWVAKVTVRSEAG